MTASAEAPRLASPSPSAAACSGRLHRVVTWAGDRLNPILVKETRQSLKSRQFVITFSLLLLLSWLWTLWEVAYVGPDIYYQAVGADLFVGYYFMLAFCLFVIVPFGAFRSLLSESEDKTYALLQITALNPRQIVRGKLGSAVMQMVIYLSSVAPCLAFTYMLRGIDFPTILFVIFYSFLFSLGLSLAAVVLATVPSERHWQVMLSVLVVIGLLFAFIGLFSFATTITTGADLSFQTAEFWQANAAFLTAYTAYFALLFYAAAGQLSFAADNRSTRLRVVMLVMQMLLSGWFAWLMTQVSTEWRDLGCVYLTWSFLHWYVLVL